MATSIKVDDSAVQRILKNYEGFINKAMPALVRKYSRLVCVELANRTQPFTVGEKKGVVKLDGNGKAKKTGKEAGENAVKAGISSVIPRVDFFQMVADSTANDKIRERLQSYVAGGEWRKFVNVMSGLGIWKEVELVSRSRMPAVHKQYRSKTTGKTLSTRGKVFVASSDVDKYIAKVQKRVGLSKSGWADAARFIRSTKGDPTRGIPAFAKKGKGGKKGIAIDKTRDVKNPRYDLKNTIPWVSRICPPKEQAMALKIARDKMIKEARIAIGKAARNKFEESIQ